MLDVRLSDNVLYDLIFFKVLRKQKPYLTHLVIMVYSTKFIIMQRDQKFTENEINALHNSNQRSEEPSSAHATRTAEKYVKKRKEKAEKQTEEEHKMENKSIWDWGSIKYVIL